MKGFELIPYVEYQGTRSLSERTIYEIWRALQKTGLDKLVFYGDDIGNEFEFLTMCKNPRNLIHFVVNEEKQPVHIAWLNTWGPNYAMAHFMFFPEVWGKCTKELGKMTLDYWFSLPTDSPLDVILGQVPAVNRMAIEFVKKLGFTELGTIPLMGHGSDPAKKCGDTFMYLTRGQHGKE